MSLTRQIEVRNLESIKGGMAEFYTPQTSHETMLVQVPARTIDDLFVHRQQTDQIVVVRGRFMLVVLENGRYRYELLRDDRPQVVTIPPGVPHGAINLEDEPCTLINALLHHGPAHAKDYSPMKPRIPYDLDYVRSLFDRGGDGD
jgi:dTDP-4-dehydrorhamnose 3,5-epimerase-like enzyme